MRAHVLGPLVWAALVVACGTSGKVSLGDDGTGLRTVDPNEVYVATRSCKTETFKHPLVCCKGAECLARDKAPFQECDDGATAYPDGTRCCSLDDPSQCTACDPKVESCGFNANGGSRSPGRVSFPPSGGCEHCPPGYTGSSSGGSCCKSDSRGGPCYGAASSGCAGVGCTPPVPCDPMCADGFALGKSQVDLCCRATAAGRSECYVWIPGDPSSLSCGTTGKACGCRRVTGGHAYQMDCDDATHACTCSLDGAPVSTLDPRTKSPGTTDVCTTRATEKVAWKDACGFPL